MHCNVGNFQDTANMYPKAPQWQQAIRLAVVSSNSDVPPKQKFPCVQFLAMTDNMYKITATVEYYLTHLL